MRARDLLWLLPLVMLAGGLSGAATYAVLEWAGWL